MRTLKTGRHRHCYRLQRIRESFAIDGVCTNDPRGNTAYTEYFATGTAPTDYCDHHILANICADSGQLAGANCPNTYATGVYVIGGSANTEDAHIF